MNKYTLRTMTWHCSQLPLTHNSPQPAHNLLSHKYANHPQLPHAEICHNSSSCWKGQGKGVFPISATLSIHVSSPIHSFSPSPRKNTSQMRACACLPPRRICRDGIRGVVQLRPRRHLEGRVHDTVRGAGQDFPRAMSGMCPLHSGRGTRRVPSGILPDVGIASA